MGTKVFTTMSEHTATSFWGGDDRGVCIQITTKHPKEDQHGYVQMTMREASALVDTLGSFIREEALRRLGLLQQEIQRLEELHGDIVRQVAELSPERFYVPKYMVALVDCYAPKVAKPPRTTLEPPQEM